MCITEDFENTAWYSAAPSFLFAEPAPRRQFGLEVHGMRIDAARDGPGGQYYRINATTPLLLSSFHSNPDENPKGTNTKADTESCRNRDIILKHRMQESWAPAPHKFARELSDWLQQQYDEHKERMDLDLCDTNIDFDKMKADGVVFSPDALDSPSRCLGEKVMIKAFLTSFLFRVQDCQSPRCLARRVLLEQAAPSCDWIPFREFTLTVLACWMPRLVWGLSTSILDEPRDTISVCLDLHGMFYLMRWARRLVYGTRIGDRLSDQYLDEDERAYDEITHKVLAPEYENRAMSMSRKCRDYGICPNRLWNLSIQSVLGTSDISYIAQMALRTPDLGRDISQGDDHKGCNEQICLYSDVNNTSVEQTHKAPCPGDCGDIEFPTRKLDEAFPRIDDQASWHQTAWLTAGCSMSKGRPWEAMSLCNSAKSSYIALSVSSSSLLHPGSPGAPLKAYR